MKTSEQEIEQLIAEYTLMRDQAKDIETSKDWLVAAVRLSNKVVEMTEVKS